ncbi:MAG: hypothetical protein ACRD0N_05435 [Acidimicrobiales bacterium]
MLSQDDGERLVEVPANDPVLGHPHPPEEGLVHQTTPVVVAQAVAGLALVCQLDGCLNGFSDFL